MWRVFAFAAFLVGGIAVSSDSMSPACRTPQGTLCRTIRYEAAGWAMVGAFTRFAAGAGPPWDRSKIRFARELGTIDIDHFSREYRVRDIFVGESPVWKPGDADCSGMAAQFLLTNVRRLGEGMIAGVRSVGFTGRSQQDARTEIWLAPSLAARR